MGPTLHAFRSATVVRFTAGDCGAQQNNQAARAMQVGRRVAGDRSLFSLPTTLSVVPEGGKTPELISELRGSGFAQEKLRVSASPFLDKATKNRPAQSRRRVLITGGFATEAVVLHAVLDASAEGYEVLVPVDACGGMSERTERTVLHQIEAAGAITTSVVSIETKLAPDFTTHPGKELFSIIQKLRLT